MSKAQLMIIPVINGLTIFIIVTFYCITLFTLVIDKTVVIDQANIQKIK
jgi:hypothetical protein